MLNSNTEHDSANKLKRKNDHRTVPRRKLRTFIWIALIINMLILAWHHDETHIREGSGAPVIDRVSFRREYAEFSRQTITFNAYFHDAEGDIAGINLEIKEERSMIGSIYSIDVFNTAGRQRRGASFNWSFRCDGYPINIDIVIIDEQGHRSQAFHERVVCFTSSPLKERWTTEG